MARVEAIRAGGVLIWQAPPETPAEIAERERLAAEMERAPRPLINCGIEDSVYEAAAGKTFHKKGCGKSLPRKAIHVSLPATVIRQKRTRAIKTVDDLRPGDLLGEFYVRYTCPSCGKDGRFIMMKGCRYTPGAWDA